MLAPALVLSVAAAAAPPPPLVVRLEAELSMSPAARRLLVAAASVPRRETRASGLPRAVDERGADKPEIVVDLERLGDLPPGEAQAEYARALARAAVAAPIPLVEAEQAAAQWTAQILEELAVEDASVAKALRAAELGPVSGAPVLNAAAAFVKRFEERPESAWWLVESGGGAPREAARLTDLEDLLTLRGSAVRALPSPPADPYAELDGRRYPAALVRSAYRIRAPGAVQALRESLAAFDTVGVATLRAALKRRRRQSGQSATAPSPSEP